MGRSRHDDVNEGWGRVAALSPEKLALLHERLADHIVAGAAGCQPASPPADRMQSSDPGWASLDVADLQARCEDLPEHEVDAALLRLLDDESDASADLAAGGSAPGPIQAIVPDSGGIEADIMARLTELPEEQLDRLLEQAWSEQEDG